MLTKKKTFKFMKHVHILMMICKTKKRMKLTSLIIEQSESQGCS